MSETEKIDYGTLREAYSQLQPVSCGHTESVLTYNHAAITIQFHCAECGMMAVVGKTAAVALGWPAGNHVAAVAQLDRATAF